MAKVISSLPGSTGTLSRTSQLINDGESGVSTYVELDDISTVATTGDYNNLINVPINFTPKVHTHNISDISGTKSEFNTSLTDGDFLFVGDVLDTPDATVTTKGILKLTGDLGGTADNPTTPTAIHKTGDEIKQGILTLSDGLKIVGNTTSTTATKVNVQENDGAVNTQTINTGFNKNIGLGGSDIVGATTLLNQYSTTPVDWTATAFNSGQVVFYGGKQWIAKMATVAGDVPAVSSKWEEITFEALANKTVIVDAIPTGGSNNAVSSNGVFDALATKAPVSSVHNPVTLGTANGLSLATQQLSLGLASSGVTGALSGTDWNTFNNKVGGSGSTNFLTKWSGTNTVNASGAWRETSNCLANAADNGVSEFQVTGQINLKSKNTQGDGGQLGAELLTTGTGDASWTGTSFATGYTHVAGSVTTLTSALAPVINNLYQVAYTVTGRTAGSFNIAFGGATTAGITSSSAVGHKASTTGTLVITPTSDFNGTIVLSIKQITAGTASFVFRDNGGTIRSELRILANGNTAIGVTALVNNTTGNYNTANGLVALQNNTTGNYNTANGVSALWNNTTGSNNTANGVGSLQNNTTGSNNTANGVYAGRFIANGSTSLTGANNSTFLGANTKALSDNSTNETVVGHNAIGDGSNTVSIGSTSVVSSRLRGRILQGNVVDNLIDSGQFSGNVLATGFKTASGTASQFLKANGSVDAMVYAPLASPSLTGTPTAPTASAGTNTTQIATTAFVAGGLATKENAFTKNTAFNKNFGTTAGTVVEGGTLGSNAYSSTAYLPLTGGTVNGSVYLNSTGGGLISFQTNSLPSALMASSQNIIGEAGSATDFNTYVYGNNPYNIWTNGVKRVTVDGSGNVDFTGTVTAPTAPAGTNTTQIATTAFVQANSSARPYKVYTALLSQSGTSAPVATVLENNLGGTVVWSYSITGEYIGTLNGAFLNNKTFLNIKNNIHSSNTEYTSSIGRINIDKIVVGSKINGTSSDGAMRASIEIRVYN